MRVVLLLLLAAVPALAADQPTEVAGLRFSAPKRWKRVETASPIVLAQFRIPSARGDKDDGDVVMFNFQDPKGTATSDHVERWYGQFTQPDDRSSKDVAVVSTRTVNGLTVKLIDLSGTYLPEMGPMEHRPRPGYRMLAAVVEGDGGPWFWRAVGPSATMAKAKDEFGALVDSFQAHP